MGCSDSRIIEETHKEMYRIIEISHKENESEKQRNKNATENLKLDLSKIKSEKETSKNNTSNIEKKVTSNIEVNPKRKISSQKTANFDIKNLYLDSLNKIISSSKISENLKFNFRTSLKIYKHPYHHVTFEKNKEIFFQSSSVSTSDSDKKEELEKLKIKIAKEMEKIKIFNYISDDRLFEESIVSEELELNSFKKEYSKTSNFKFKTSQKCLLIIFRLEVSENLAKIVEICKLNSNIKVLPIVANQINSKDDFDYFKEKISILSNDVDICYINSRNTKLYGSIMKEINLINSYFSKTIDYNATGAPSKSDNFDFNLHIFDRENINFKSNLNTIIQLSSKALLMENSKVILNCNLLDLTTDLKELFNNISYCTDNCSFKNLKNLVCSYTLALNEKMHEYSSEEMQDTKSNNLSNDKLTSNKINNSKEKESSRKENNSNSNSNREDRRQEKEKEQEQDQDQDQEDHLETSNLNFTLIVYKTSVYEYNKDKKCLIKQKVILSPIMGNIYSQSKFKSLKIEDIMINSNIMSKYNNYNPTKILNIFCQLNIEEKFNQDFIKYLKNSFKFIEDFKITQNIKRKIHLLEEIEMTKSVLQIVDCKAISENAFDEIQNFNDINKGMFHESKYVINSLPKLFSKFDSKKGEQPKLILILSLEDEEENISQINFLKEFKEDVKDLKDRFHMIIFNRPFDLDDVGDNAKKIIEELKDFKLSKLPNKLKKIQISDKYHGLFMIITTPNNDIIYSGSGIEVNLKKTLENISNMSQQHNSNDESSKSIFNLDPNNLIIFKKNYLIPSIKFQLLKEKIKYYLDKICLNLIESTKRFYKPFIEFSYNKTIDDNKNKNYHKLKIILTLSKDDYMIISKEKSFSKFLKILKDNNCFFSLDYSTETRKINLKSKKCSSCSEIIDYERNGFYDQKLNKAFCFSCETKLNNFEENNFNDTNMIVIKCSNNEKNMEFLLNGIYSTNYEKYIERNNNGLEPIDDTFCSICNHKKLINERVVWLSLLHFYNDYNINENFIICDSNCFRRLEELQNLKTKFGNVKNLCKTKNINNKSVILNKISETKEFLRMTFNELEIERIYFNNFDPLNFIMKKIIIKDSNDL